MGDWFRETIGCSGMNKQQQEHLFGQSIWEDYEIGTPNYCMSPKRKALWECSYKFSSADLEAIYKYSQTHLIAFGKIYLVNLHDDRGDVAFLCWHPNDTVRDIQTSIKAQTTPSWNRGSRYDPALLAIDVMLKRRTDLIQERPLVSLHPDSDYVLRHYRRVFPFLATGETYGDAIEQGIFLQGLDRVGEALS